MPTPNLQFVPTLQLVLTRYIEPHSGATQWKATLPDLHISAMGGSVNECLRALSTLVPALESEVFVFGRN